MSVERIAKVAPAGALSPLCENDDPERPHPNGQALVVSEGFEEAQRALVNVGRVKPEVDRKATH